MMDNKPKPWWKSSHNLMMLGCIPLMGFAVLGNESIGGAGILLLIACPLMHLLMMKGMGKKGCHQQSEENLEPKKVALVSPKSTQAQKEF